MRRHEVLTHVNHPAKRFIFFTGIEALWMSAASGAGLLLWRALVPVCTPALAADPTTGLTAVVAEAPVLVWARDRFPSAGAGLTMYVPFVPLLVFFVVVGLVALFVLWEPGGKKPHRWAAIYVHTWLRGPRVATWQPVRPTPRRARSSTSGAAWS